MSLITCLLLLVAIAVNKNHKLLGSDLARHDKGAAIAPLQETLDDGTTIVYTQELAKDITGYGGNVPLKIYIKDNHITQIEALDNSESPEFFEKVKANVLNKWNGLTPDVALRQHIDAVSGATFSSRATIESVQRGLQYARGIKAEKTFDYSRMLNAGYIASLLVVLGAAIIPFFVHTPRYRYAQLALNVAVLGLWTGTFLSYSSIVSYLSNGIKLSDGLIPFILIVIAAVYPLLGKKSHYCTWVCPLGSAQELVGRSVKFNLKLSPRLIKNLGYARELLWMGLMLVMLTGVYFDWMNYELFSIFIFSQASTVVIALAAIFLLLSSVVMRPYCRFVCPTGTLFKITQNQR